MIQKFTMRTLATLDGGRVAAALEQSFGRCRDDCHDRPHDETARKITLTVEFKPEMDDRGDLDSINVACNVSDKVPDRRSKVYNMRVSGQSMLFDELSPEDADQATLPLGSKAGEGSKV